MCGGGLLLCLHNCSFLGVSLGNEGVSSRRRWIEKPPKARLHQPNKQDELALVVGEATVLEHRNDLIAKFAPLFVKMVWDDHLLQPEWLKISRPSHKTGRETIGPATHILHLDGVA